MEAEGKRKVTIKDVAARCGLSKSAVAYILNNSPSYKPSEESRKLVLEAAKELGYRPNLAARSLREKKAYTVGILMPAAGSNFYAEMLLSIQARLRENGYYGLFAFWSMDAESIGQEVVEPLLQRNVDGIISWPGTESIIPKELPCVLFSYKSCGYDSVAHDFEDAMEKAFEHLLGLGHRRIGFIGKEGDIRHKLFESAVKARGLELKPEWLRFGDGLEAGRAGAKEILSQTRRPSAIICYNDMVALAGISSAWELGIAVPDEVSFLGFDNIAEAAYCHPPLSSFDLRLDDMAEALVDMLIERIESPGLPPRRILIKTDLLPRKSTGPCERKSYGDGE